MNCPASVAIARGPCRLSEISLQSTRNSRLTPSSIDGSSSPITHRAGSGAARGIDCLMCGISGVVALDREGLPAVIDAQMPLLEHRGPDAHGHFEGSGGVIAQNRLAIIDLVSGDPPITNEDRSVAVVLNGEIYNFRELR